MSALTPQVGRKHLSGHGFSWFGRQLHARIAQRLEGGAEELLATQPEVLAHHHSAAGQTEKAISYWWEAGRRAAERSANLEAIAHLSHGLASFQKLTPSQDQLLLKLEMQVTLGVALVAAKGWAAPDTSEAFARARELCVLTGNRSHLTKVNWGEQTGYLMRGPLSLALEKSEDMLEQAKDRHDDIALLMAHRTIGITSVHLGLAEAALKHLDEAYRLYVHETHCEAARQYGYDVDIAVAVYAAHPLLHLGYPDRARKRLDAASNEARLREHRPSLAFAFLHNGQFHQVFGDLPANQELVEQQIALCTEHGFDAWRASGQVQRGSILFQAGQRDDGLAEMERALKEWREPGVALRVPLFLIDVAKARAQMGDVEAAQDRLSEALGVIEQSGECWHKPEILRLKGELLASSSKPDAPEAAMNFRKAIALAQHQNAKWAELRAATSLAQWLYGRGEGDDAHDLLKPVVDWFTEGFEAPDLIRAKALLRKFR